MPADNHVHSTMKARIPVPVVITLGSDGTSYRGTLVSIHPQGTDISDAGASATANDYVSLTVKLNRAKS